MGRVRETLHDALRQTDAVLLALCVASTLYGMVLIASATSFRGTLKYVAVQGLGLEYICFQLRHAGDISFKKMFGEYGLYCDRKYFGLVCDNQLFVKITEPGLKLLPQQEQGSPYPGARPHFLMTELDDDRALSSFVRATCSVLSAPDVLSGKKKKASGEKRNRRP